MLVQTGDDVSEVPKWFEAGEVYPVYELVWTSEVKSVRLRSKRHHGIWPVDLNHLEIINGQISEYWRVRCLESGGVRLAPGPFFLPHFLHDLIDYKKWARRVFERVRVAIRAEHDLPLDPEF